MPKRKKRRGKKQQHQALTEQLLTVLRKHNTTPLNYKQIAAHLGVNDPSTRNHITKKLKKLTEKGTIHEVSRGKYVLVPSKDSTFVYMKGPFNCVSDITVTPFVKFFT